METTSGQTTFQARANLAAAGTDVMFTQGKGAKASENLLYIKCMWTCLHVDSLDHVWPQWQPWGLYDV